MCKESGDFKPMSKEARQARGLSVWEDGDLFRPGKTRREERNGVKANYLRNKEARRAENRQRDGKKA